MHGLRRWDLVLNKPYSDGGYENSSRVQKNGWDNVGVKAAAKVHGCTLNDPSSGPCKGWTAEVAFPLAGLSFNNTNTVPPKPGSYWRCALTSPPTFSCDYGCSSVIETRKSAHRFRGLTAAVDSHVKMWQDQLQPCGVEGARRRQRLCPRR